MKNHPLLWICLFALFFSCNDEPVENNLRSAFDCELNLDSDFIGICINGVEAAMANETLRYASKASAIFDEITWSINSGNLEIIEVETTVEEDYILSIAIITFAQDFDGGSISVVATDTFNNIAQIPDYQIQKIN